MDWACRTRGRCNSVYRILVENLKGNYHLGDRDIDDRVILASLLKNRILRFVLDSYGSG
jgi:hypothetical protein